MTEYNVEDIKFKIQCYKTVKNVHQIINKIRDDPPKVTLFDSRIILSLSQIQSAIFMAKFLESNGKMQSKNLYIEILRMVSPDCRIEAALKLCNINEGTKSVVAVTLEDSFPVIEGLEDPVSFETFMQEPGIDYDYIKSGYRITDDVLKVYTYEQILQEAQAVTVSGIVRFKTKL